MKVGVSQSPVQSDYWSKLSAVVVRLESRINETAYIFSSHGPCNTMGSGAVMCRAGEQPHDVDWASHWRGSGGAC